MTHGFYATSELFLSAVSHFRYAALLAALSRTYCCVARIDSGDGAFHGENQVQPAMLLVDRRSMTWD